MGIGLPMAVSVTSAQGNPGGGATQTGTNPRRTLNA
jgi:hypothetical protein